MEFHHDEALVLDVRDLHDRDRIVTFLARGAGKKSGVASGARRPFSRFAGQLQPLAKVRVAWTEKAGRELARVTSVELVRPAAKLQADLEGILLGAYLADHLLEFAQESEGNDLYFRLLDSTLEALLAGVDRDLAARYFEAWVLRLAGIFPAPRECPLCGRRFPAEGAVLPPAGEGLICPECAGGSADAPGSLAVDAAVVEFLLRIGGSSLSDLAPGAPPPAVLRRVERLCAHVRRRFLQHELRSYDVIQRTREGF